MILVDLNQVMISNMMVSLGAHKNANIDVNMLRHMVLNSIRSYRQKFRKDYGELVICADDKNYWRRDMFQYYKASRKKARATSELDWQEIFKALNMIREELKTFFPYKVIHIEHVEADDIIGTLVHKYGQPINTGEPILILSGDKDYIQLHKYLNVKQYDPVSSRWIKHSDPVRYLKEHVIKGDRGDGIPNVYSDDNCFVMGVRQTTVTAKRLAAAMDINSVDDKFKEKVKRGIDRNTKLIDLSHVPDVYKEKIMQEFETTPSGNRSHLFNYFMKNKLKHLMEHLNEY